VIIRSGHSTARRLLAVLLAAASLLLLPSPLSAQTRDMSGRIIERSPLKAARDTLVVIEVHPLGPGVYAAKNRYVWNGWVELPEGILVVDGGYDARSAAALADTIRARSRGRPFRYLVVTSGHTEHIGGIRTFASLGATVLAHPEVAAAIRDSIPVGARPAADGTAKSASQPPATKKGKTGSKKAAPEGPKGPLAEVKARTTLGPADRRVVVEWLGMPANSAGDLVVHLPKQRALFTGDLAWHRAVPWIVDSRFSYKGWLASLDTLLTKRFDADSVVPGHGAMASKIDGLMYTRRYLVEAMDRAAKLAGWGVAVGDMDEQGYLGPYEDAEYYDPIHFYNMRRLHQLAKGIETPGRAHPGMVAPR
jgi:glyoxylase-like metal-dependent hydrolase (beta-lactamase superfamily II)